MNGEVYDSYWAHTVGLRAEDLWDLYWDLGWGLPRIAQKLGVAPNTVRALMLENGIQTRKDLTRWYQPKPWQANLLESEERDPADPAGYWGCAKTSRAGVGCLLCGERPPEGCELNCQECPPRAYCRVPLRPPPNQGEIEESINKAALFPQWPSPITLRSYHLCGGSFLTFFFGQNSPQLVDRKTLKLVFKAHATCQEHTYYNCCKHGHQ